MRIDPDSVQAKAKMRALDKLVDLLDYSNTKMKHSGDTESEVEQAERAVEHSLDDEHLSDSDDRSDEAQFERDGEREPDDVTEAADELQGYKTIDMRRARSSSAGDDGLKRAAREMPDGANLHRKRK